MTLVGATGPTGRGVLLAAPGMGLSAPVCSFASENSSKASFPLF